MWTSYVEAPYDWQSLTAVNECALGNGRNGNGEREGDSAGGNLSAEFSAKFPQRGENFILLFARQLVHAPYP